MITYEASLVCDGCLAAIAGCVTQHMQHALQSAIAAGEHRYWLIIPPRHGETYKTYCPTCRANYNEHNHEHKIPSQDQT